MESSVYVSNHSNYCPDFSDMCNESYQFWDFLKKDDLSNQQEAGNGNVLKEEENFNIPKEDVTCQLSDCWFFLRKEDNVSVPQEVATVQGNQSTDFVDFLRKEDDLTVSLETTALKCNKSEFWDFLPASDSLLKHKLPSNELNQSKTICRRNIRTGRCFNEKVNSSVDTCIPNSTYASEHSSYECGENNFDSTENHFWDFLDSEISTPTQSKNTEFVQNRTDKSEEIIWELLKPNNNDTKLGHDEQRYLGSTTTSKLDLCCDLSSCFLKSNTESKSATQLDSPSSFSCNLSIKSNFSTQVEYTESLVSSCPPHKSDYDDIFCKSTTRDFTSNDISYVANKLNTIKNSNVLSIGQKVDENKLADKDNGTLNTSTNKTSTKPNLTVKNLDILGVSCLMKNGNQMSMCSKSAKEFQSIADENLRPFSNEEKATNPVPESLPFISSIFSLKHFLNKGKKEDGLSEASYLSNQAYLQGMWENEYAKTLFDETTEARNVSKAPSRTNLEPPPDLSVKKATDSENIEQYNNFYQHATSKCNNRKRKACLTPSSPIGCSQFNVKDYQTGSGFEDINEIDFALKNIPSHKRKKVDTICSGNEEDNIIIMNSFTQPCNNVISLNTNYSSHTDATSIEADSPIITYESPSIATNSVSAEANINASGIINVFTQSSKMEALSAPISASNSLTVSSLASIPAVARVNNTNSTPLYFLLPNSSHTTDSQKHVQLLMVINDRVTSNQLAVNSQPAALNANNLNNNSSNILNNQILTYPAVSSSFLDAQKLITSCSKTIPPFPELKPVSSFSHNDNTCNYGQRSCREVSNGAILQMLPLGVASNLQKSESSHTTIGLNSLTISQPNSQGKPPSSKDCLTNLVQSHTNTVMNCFSSTELCNFNKAPSQTNIKTQKPIKNISLGKDKNAIQQTSVPLKLENLLNIKEMSKTHVSDLLHSSLITNHDEAELSYQFDKNRTNICTKNDIIGLNTSDINRNSHKTTVRGLDCMATKQSSQPTTDQKGLIFVNANFTAGSHSTQSTATLKVNDSKSQCITNGGILENKNFKTQTTTTLNNSKETLTTLQGLLPSPISMFPVCVIPAVQPVSKPLVSKILVLQSQHDQVINQNLNLDPIGNRQKMILRKRNLKYKKMGRKTVRELLQEKKEKEEKQTLNNMRPDNKILRPIFKYPTSVLVPTAMPIATAPNTRRSFATLNQTASSNKRPNILILPSAAKQNKDHVLQQEIPNVSNTENFRTIQSMSTRAAANTNAPENAFTVPSPQNFLPPFKTDKVCSKDYRPRHYDMCELIIGYFKVQDDVDSHGRFRSKFKVLFTKRQFLYDFPVSRCNQVDLSSLPMWEQMARIIVPFKSVLAMDLNNRKINVQVSGSPLIFLGRIQARSGIISSATVYDTPVSNSSIWGDCIRSSLLHKITLRKRQADKLKTHLCKFDQRFLTLTSMDSYIGESPILDASPFDEDSASEQLQKAFNKSKKTLVRHLPQWDFSLTDDPIMTCDSESNVLPSNQVCSCRISCRSVRCSCVKAAKSCRTGGSVCLCINCDNPLNVLESLGLNLEFSLRDRCLFQSIYQIPKLLNYLQREIKLSCCNTIGRVQDCIPGTVLCPNLECNAQLEFSWCRGIICFPERNPRNHCSRCGQCCFSNGRHCEDCNRCYVVTSKCPVCPNCRDKKRTSYRSKNSSLQQSFRVTPISGSELQKSAKSNFKPEIILLDGSASTKDAELSEKSDKEFSDFLASL